MTRIIPAVLLTVTAAFAQAPELGQGWMQEFNLASRQILQLAEATPEAKFSWRPAPNVRSVSEVYMHIAVGNFFLLGQAGFPPPPDGPKLVPGLEKKVTAKADVIQWLKDSQDAVRRSYPKADLTEKVKFFGRDATKEGVLLRLLVHNHEHMGQSIAYARMMGVAPPWSKE